MESLIKNLICLTGIILIISACNDPANPDIESGVSSAPIVNQPELIHITKAQFEMNDMKLGQFGTYQFSHRVRATGTIDVPVKNHIRVSAYAGGYVRHINLIPGQSVTKGQVLFTLENPEVVQMQQDYLEAIAQQAYLQADFERQKTLADERISSRKNFLKAESDFQVNTARVEGLKKKLSLLGIDVSELSASTITPSITVFAPSSGYITEVYAMRGMFLSPTDVAVELINTSQMHLELTVFEKDVLDIQKGQQIRFRIPDSGPETFLGEVHTIGKTVEGDNRIVRIHGLLNQADKAPEFVPGMYVEADILTESWESRGLPESAVVEVEDNYFALVSVDTTNGVYQFEQREVHPGIRENGILQVINQDSFPEGLPVLIEGAFNLINIE